MIGLLELKHYLGDLRADILMNTTAINSLCDKYFKINYLVIFLKLIL